MANAKIAEVEKLAGLSASMWNPAVEAHTVTSTNAVEVKAVAALADSIWNVNLLDGDDTFAKRQMNRNDGHVKIGNRSGDEL